ncbi:MAG: PaaI family thioesterase [Pseudomonadota bacterium]
MKDNIYLASMISPHTELLGSEFESWDPETLTATMRFTVKRDVITARGGVQGGLVAGYLDDVMGYAHVLSTDGELAPLTLELSMSLLKPVLEGTIIGKGRVVKAGRRVIYLEGELLSEDGEVLARATSTNIPTPRPTGADIGTK